MSAPVDVLAVLGRHVALAEQVGCREQQAEAQALFDAVTELIAAVQQRRRALTRSEHREALVRELAALRAVGGVE